MIGARKLAEVLCEPLEEMKAREGVCPACSGMGFLGVGAAETTDGTLSKVPVGTCVCKDCFVIWWYPLAARRHWN
jgi:hypothetical protein